MRNVILAFAVSAMSFSPAFGDGPRRVIGTGTKTSGALNSSNVIRWTWEDTSITGPVVTPWSVGSNTCVYVLHSWYNTTNELRLTRTSALPDVDVYLENDFSIRAMATTDQTYTFPRVTVKAGSDGILQSTYSTATFNGGWTIDPGVTFPVKIWNTGNGAMTANITLINSPSSYLAGDADTVITYGYTLKEDYANSTNGMTVGSTLTIGIGDASAFKGKYVMSDHGYNAAWTNLSNRGYSARGHLKFLSATAFGDPTEEKADAVKLGESAYLSLGAGVAQYATRGVTITSKKKGGVEAARGDSWILTAPVTCGNGATFEKVGEGIVTLDGDCTGVPAIEVTEGTLVLGALGSFANGLAVTVKSGATLVQNKYVGNINVTCEAGGVYTEDIQYVVPYSDAAGTSTPLDFTAAVPDLPLSIRLSESVEIASFAGNGYTAKRIDVARLPSDSNATVADFVDATVKFCCLPKTYFEIESREGYKALVLVARPVVWSVGRVGDNDSNGYGLNGNVRLAPGSSWSYGITAQPGYDYFVTHYIQGTGHYPNEAPAFLGDSLTVNNASIAMTSRNVDIGNATFCGDVKMYYNQSYLGWSGSKYPFTGVTRGSATIADNSMLTLQTRHPGGDGFLRTNCLSVAVSGSGALCFTSGTLNGSSLDYCVPGGAPVYLTGDNSGFSGKMTVTCVGSPTEVDGTTLHLGHASSFGGAMPAETADGLLLEKYGFLYPEETMTLDAANRGIKIVSGGFDVPEGVALTVGVPVVIDGAAVKKGAGELALGGAATFASGSFTVKEGAVRALSDDAVAGDFAFADGTTIVQDPEVTLVNGFTGTFSVVGEGTPKVYVSFDKSHARSNVYTIPVCTVSSSVADLTDSIEFAAVRGYTVQLVKENVTVGGEPCVRYSAEWRRSGFILSFR